MSKKNSEELNMFPCEKKGYDKAAVKAYIADLESKYQEEIASLKAKYEELRNKNDEITGEYIKLQSQKSEVASVLINAEETKAVIIENAKKTAMDECIKLDGEIETRKRLIVSENEQLRRMRLESEGLLKNYCDKLAEMLEKTKAETDKLVNDISSEIGTVNESFSSSVNDFCERNQ